MTDGNTLESLSHNLRTSLNAIFGFTGTLLMRLPGPINAEQENLLRIIRSSAEQLQSQINCLLEAAGIESDTAIPLEPAPVFEKGPDSESGKIVGRGAYPIH